MASKKKIIIGIVAAIIIILVLSYIIFPTPWNNFWLGFQCGISGGVNC